MIRHFYYNKQLKRFITGFANIFTGMQVMTGYDECTGDVNMIEVPIRYGSVDRVVAAIGSSFTQNKQFSLPAMACYMTTIELAPDRMHGVNQVDRRTVLEQGGVYPTDVKGIRRVMPIPYNMEMELSVYTSNTDQMFQIFEQIATLFDPTLQIEFSDAPFDWARQTQVTLTGLSNEEVYPLGTERRAIQWTWTFEMPIWIGGPMDVRSEIVQSIKLRMGDIDQLALNEIDENGDMQPFNTPYSETTISIPSPDTITPASPELPSEYTAQHFDPGEEDCKC